MKKSFTAKLWNVMRICAVHAIVTITLCGVALSHPNYAQLLDKEVSITMTDLPFESALKELEKVAAVKFAYSIDQLENEPNVTLLIENQSLRYVLEELLTARNIRYNVHEKDAVITLQKISRGEDKRSIFDDTNGKHKNRDPIDVAGTVTEASTGTPMAGVNVLVKGTATGTTTDSDGRYILAAGENDVLVFSFIGYSSIEVPVNRRTLIDVAMTQDVLSLGEVVVNAGYWEVKEQERTGNISRVTGEEIQNQPVNNPLQALQGRMTGVYIEQDTGVPGGGFSIQVRGRNSLRTGTGGTVDGNLPLYLVDGIPFTATSLTSGSISSGNLRGGNPLSVINPSDIESIEVLKDADATSVYGSRGANGVVLITTKRAKAGKPTLDINMSSGIGKVTRMMNLLSTPEYLEMRKEAIGNDGYTSLVGNPQFDSYWPDVSLWDSTRYTDWQRKLIGGTGHISDAQISLSGGTTQTQYLVSGSYYRESTVFPGSNDFKRATGRMTLNHTSQDQKFRLLSSMNYAASFSDIPSADLATLAVTLSPNAPALHDPSGKLNWENGTWINPLSQLERKYNNGITNLVSNLTTSYEIIDGLRVKAGLGYTRMNVDEIRISPLSAHDPSDVTGRTASSNFGDSNISTWIIEPQVDYTKLILNGQLSLLAGTTLQQSVEKGKTIRATGYTNDALLENIDAAAEVSISDASYAQYRYIAAFFRINYAWKEKLILNLTGRRDGSSRFGSGRQYANFGAVGAAWIFSNEKLFARTLEFISFGKLRSSFGTTGSDAIGNYQFLETYAAGRYQYDGSAGLVLSRLSNPEYSWETNRKFEVAMDLGVWQDRLILAIAYYNNRSSNQLVGLPLPVMTGQSSVQYNLPAKVENKGWEFQLTSANIRKRHFDWSTSMNLTLPENRLISFPDLSKFPAYLNRYEVGKSVYSFKGLQYTGVNPETGLYEFTDLDGNGGLDNGDNTILGQVTQTAYGGVNNGFRYRSFQLDVFVQFVRQTGFNYQRSFSFPGYQSNQHEVVMNRWRTENDRTDIQKFTSLDPDGSVSLAYAYAQFSDQAVVDASFIRLKNISISWELPKSWLAKSPVQYASVYVQGQNLLTFTNYIGLDPENQTSTAIPPLTMLTAGVQVKL